MFLLLVINGCIETQCDTNAASSLHTHSVSTAEVIKAVKRLITFKYNDFQHGNIFIIYTYQTYWSIVFSYVTLRLCNPTIFTFHCDTNTKGGKVCSTNADLYRSIAISSILSKILDMLLLTNKQIL